MSVNITATPAATNPPTVRMNVTDTFWLGINLAPALPTGGSVTGTPVVTLTEDKQGGKKITLETPPSLTGSTLSVLLTGSDLKAGTYTLQVVFNGGSSAPALTTRTTIVVSA